FHKCGERRPGSGGLRRNRCFIWTATDDGFRSGVTELLGWRYDRHHGADAVRAGFVDSPTCSVDVGLNFSATYRYHGCARARVRLLDGAAPSALLYTLCAHRLD